MWEKTVVKPYTTSLYPTFLKYESKNCPFCQNSIIHKHGKINNIERYKCTSCNKTFTFQKKLNPSDIWKDYSQGKQTYKELSIKYQCLVKTDSKIYR